MTHPPVPLELTRLNEPSAELLDAVLHAIGKPQDMSDAALCDLPALVYCDTHRLAHLYLPGSAAERPAWAAELLPQARWSSLQTTRVLAGASAAAPPTHHYVVETDVLAGWEDEFNDWYNIEHLPGLASVPGTVRAARSLSDEGPRHFASYELAGVETFESPPWLAVRGSDWSSRVRPAFRNTRRWMFRRLSLPR